jgi:hypothetical protein
MVSRIWLIALSWLRCQQASALHEDLERRLADAERQMRELRFDNERLDSMLKIRDEELKLLTAVNVRNQTRVEAETAEAAQRIALSQIPEERKRLTGYGA